MSEFRDGFRCALSLRFDKNLCGGSAINHLGHFVGALTAGLGIGLAGFLVWLLTEAIL